MMSSKPLSDTNPILARARQAKLRLPRQISPGIASTIDKLYPLLAILFSLLCPIFASIPASIAVIAIWLAVAPETSLDSFLYGDNFRLTLYLIANFAPIFIFQWIWLWLIEQRPMKSLGLVLKSAGKKYLRGALIGFVMILLSVGVPAGFGQYTVQYFVTTGSGVILPLGILISLIGWIVQGAAEELLFRGYLMPVISVRYGAVWGVLISSCTFAALHLLNENLTILALVNLLLFGIFAALYTLADQSLWGIFAIHSLWNWAQGSLFGLSVSGSHLGDQAPIQLINKGPAWLTGGAFGPEGGIAVTLVLVAAIIWVLYTSQIRREQKI